MDPRLAGASGCHEPPFAGWDHARVPGRAGGLRGAPQGVSRRGFSRQPFPRRALRPRATLESSEGYQIIEDFIATVGDRHLQDRLELAIRGRGAFRRFKDVLAEYPRERERWFAFHDTRLRELVLRWLASEGIEALTE